MKSCICLIILGFLQFEFVDSIFNTTEKYKSFASCPFSNIRRKRAQADYTRWRANLDDTSEEFIVQVLDEDFTTPLPNPIVAINILPATERQEKIIVGAIVPTQTSNIQEKDMIKEYTRFVPPTIGSVTITNNDIILGPLPRSKVADFAQLEPRGPSNRGWQSLRDDSPPASPQFLPRTSIISAEQYAPITPVAFKKWSSLNPFVYFKQGLSVPTKTTFSPVQTNSRDLMFLPTRTKATSNNEAAEEATNSPEYNILTRTTVVTQPPPLRTLPTTGNFKVYGLSEVDNKLDDSDEEKTSETNHPEPSSIYYNDDDESGDKKLNQSSGSSYEEKEEHGDELLDTEMSLTTKQEVLSTNNFSDTLENKLSSDHIYIYDEDSSNDTTARSDFTNSASANVETENRKDKRNSICNLLKLRQLNFNSPRTLSEIVAQLKQWAENSPLAKWKDITGGNYTTMENPIYLMIVDDPSSGQIISAKQTVMIVAGIQGRDHHAVAAAMYVLYQLIERSEAHVDLLSKYRFWVIPVFNPDGYDYSMTFPFRRGWTKNLKQSWDICSGRESCYACENYGLRCTIKSCYGVNLDRNFEYQWIPAAELRSEHPCGDLYAGSRQLSEPETLALTHFLHQQRTPLYTFIAFKEGSILGVMYPYSHTRKNRAFDHIYRQRATRAASAAHSISGRPYVAGQTSEFLPLYAGGIEDWVDGHLGIDNTFTIMMFRHTDAYNSKLITERVVHEAYAAMDTLLLQSTEPFAPGPVILTSNRRRNAVKLHFANSNLVNLILFMWIFFL